jgi:hypothetical protein
MSHTPTVQQHPFIVRVAHLSGSVCCIWNIAALYKVLNYVRLSVSSIAKFLKVLVVENHTCIAVTFLGLFDHSSYSDE